MKEVVPSLHHVNLINRALVKTFCIFICPFPQVPITQGDDGMHFHFTIFYRLLSQSKRTMVVGWLSSWLVCKGHPLLQIYCSSLTQVLSLSLSRRNSPSETQKETHKVCLSIKETTRHYLCHATFIDPPKSVSIYHS